ncbi:MAG: hypothetical protein H6523_13210 [Mycolicibacterium sp.]|nr:hypothetical protein [Mycolicibacterium sp.]
MTITLEKQGRRYYLRGTPYAARDSLRWDGCKWDAEARAWWTGKKDVAESLLAELREEYETVDGQEKVGRSHRVLRGRAKYKDKSYYLLADGRKADGSRYAKLCSLDGALVFWAKDFERFEVVKRYRSEQSIAGLAEFAARRKREAAGGPCECWCHGSRHCDCDRGFCAFHHDGCDSCGCEN